MKSQKFVRHAGAVSFATLLSRILGYVRDALVASAFGGGHLTDAFYAAFRLSNLFRRMLGEGPLATAFVPVFSQHLAQHEAKEARDFFQSLFTSLGVLLFVLVAVGVAASPWIVSVAAGGFKSSHPETFDLTVTLTRQMFPFLFFVCLAAISSAALNSVGHFFIPAVAPAMLSVATIVYVVCIKRWAMDPLQGLAISTTVGGALHLAMVWPLLRREGMAPRWNWNPGHPDIRRVALLIVPALWGLSIDQVNSYVDTICASFLQEGSVTALYNSNRLMQFALALFGVSISTATLPHLSMSAAREEWGEFKENLNFSLRVTLYLVIPAMVGLILLAYPLVKTLFQHGLFTEQQTLMTASALAAYTLGLPAYAVVKVVVTAFYARKDTKTPVKVATFCLILNMLGNVLLMRRWGVGGLAFSTAFASVVNGGVLLWLLRQKMGRLGGRKILRTIAGSGIASLFMALGAWGVLHAAPGPLPVRALCAVATGTALYLLVSRIGRLEEFGHLRDLLRRRRAPPLPID
jgi:putative peptidoglycan lipid II flippase